MAVRAWASPTQISEGEQGFLYRNFVPIQAFRVLPSCPGAKGKEKWGYCIGTSSAVRLNLQMETGNSLKLKSAGRSAMWGALAEGCEEVHMLCSADCNDLLINNTFQLLAKP